jgi:predicted nucleic acid-binding protein
MTNKVLMPLIVNFSLSQEFHDVYKKRFIESCELLDKIQTIKKSDHKFLIEELSIGELFSAVRNEVRTIVLFVSGVPMSRWGNERGFDRENVSESILKQIRDDILKGLEDLAKNEKLQIVETHTPSNDDDFIEVYSSIIFLLPGLQTQDAIILSSAILENADYLVTTDRYLLSLKKVISDQYNLQILKPATALIELKKT